MSGDSLSNVCLLRVYVLLGRKVTSLSAARSAGVERESEAWRSVSLWRNTRWKACKRLRMALLERSRGQPGVGVEESSVG